MWPCLLLLVALLVPGLLSASPRLHLNPPLLLELRRLVGDAASPHAEMLAELQLRASRDLRLSGAYDRAYSATLQAFLSQLTTDPAPCAAAFDALQLIEAHQGPDRYTPVDGYGLARATVTSGFAYAYDWCHDFWSPSQISWVRGRLLASLYAWQSFRHANIEAPHRGSNWVSVCRAGELLAMLALREEFAHAARYAQIKEDLRLHMRNFDELGVSQEGIGYTAYGGIFLLRALLALRSVGDTSLDAEAANHAWWRQAMYAGTFADAGGGRLWLGSGVSGSGIGDEGWASLLFAFTPSSDLPYFKWWYDRHLGPLSSLPVSRRWDPRREGILWALLFYPAALPARDPTNIYPLAVCGRHGLILARSRWRDANDILLSFAGDASWHSHAWDQPEALQFRLIAGAQSWVGGPEKTRDPAQYSSWLVDGQIVAPSVRGATGRLLSFSSGRGRARFDLDGAAQYESLGVKISRRVDLRLDPAGRLRLRMEDSLSSSRLHLYTWQWNLGDHQADGGLNVRADGTDRFQIEGPRARLRGLISSSTLPRLIPGDPFRMEWQGSTLRATFAISLDPLQTPQP